MELVGYLLAISQKLGNLLSRIPAALTTAGHLQVSVEEVNAALGPVGVVLTPGLLAYRTLDLDETGQVVKATAGKVYGYHLINAAVAARYVKIYDKATAPTGADTPVLTLALAAGADLSFHTDLGIVFGTGIGLRATTGIADADAGAPAANDVVANVLYY